MQDEAKKVLPVEVNKNDDYITIDFRGLTLPWAIVLSVFIVTIGIGSAVYFGLKARPIVVSSSSIPTGTPTPMPTFSATEFGEVSLPVAARPYFGSKDAPVVMVEFGDFICPFCQKFYTESFPYLAKEYLDTGKVKLEYREFPLSIHDPAATTASKIGICIYNTYGLNKFQAYHNLLAASPNTYVASTSQGTELKTEQMKALLETIQTDYTKVMNCTSNSSTAATLKADKDVFGALNTFAVEKGFEPNGLGTPLLIIGRVQSDGTIKGRLINGAYPYSAFKAVIEEQLAK